MPHDPSTDPPSRERQHRAAHKLVAYALEQLDSDADLTSYTKSCLLGAVLALRDGDPLLAFVEATEVLSPPSPVEIADFEPRARVDALTLADIAEAFADIPPTIC